MWTRRKVLVVGTVALAVSGACATSNPPRELVEAREQFEKASAGPAAQLNPAGLSQAKTALARANQEFEQHPSAPSTADFAYVALRRAQLAEAQAQMILATQQRLGGDRRAREPQAQRQAREQELRNTGRQIGGSGPGPPQAGTPPPTLQVPGLQAQESGGQKRKATREDKAQQLRSRLASIAPARLEQRGIVIALPESALFTSGRSTLKPSARRKLNQLAATLMDGQEKIVVEGHTDSSGSDSSNAGLSERRAITVRNYLRDRGISADRMTALGLGATRPRANNATREGRAKNRRVEIIVDVPAAVSTG